MRRCGFDLVIVDGDRTEAGADQTFADIMPYVAGGGVVVFDGLNDPDHPYLLEVWQRWESRLAEGFGFASTSTTDQASASQCD
jgi:hypothetical protein